MKKVRRWVVLVSVVALGMAAVPQARAHAPGASNGVFERRPLLGFVFEGLGRLARLKRQLDLTGEQKARLRELLKSRKPEIVQAVTKVRAGRKKVRALVQAGAPDEAAIRAAVTGMAGALADAAVLRSHIRRDVLAVLTPEQRGRVDKFMAEAQTWADEAFAEFSAK